MRIASVFTAIAVFLSYGSLAMAQEHAPIDPCTSTLKQCVDGYMQPFLKQYGVPGAIVGISIHGKRTFYAYGNATDQGAQFTPTTLVEIGSITKVFTTTLFALAVEHHQMDPNQSAQLYMPKGVTLQPLAQKITPLQIADFTSGIPRVPSNLDPNAMPRSLEDYTTKDFFEWLSKWQPAGPPPAPYLYSNAGIGLLGYLVEDATGTTWESQLNRRIVGPLGMVDTEMRPNEEQMKRTATGHDIKGADTPAWPICAWYAAGALRSTALDMLKFGEANLGHSKIDGKPIPNDLISAMKMAQTPIYLLDGGQEKQGMAWVIELGKEQSESELWKGGGTAGFRTMLLINPAKDIAVFIAVNQSGDGGANPKQVAVQLGRSPIERLP
jgi:CubicO group peptidase (beta-lactamase class C family)